MNRIEDSTAPAGAASGARQKPSDRDIVSLELQHQPPFHQVCEMEKPLETTIDMLRALSLLAEGMDKDYASVVQRISWHGLDQCRRLEDLRSELFHLTHPNQHLSKTEGAV